MVFVAMQLALSEREEFVTNVVTLGEEEMKKKIQKTQKPKVK